MTEWKTRSVRHIPEAELHAYLDQALSRSQCVEIERHLAECATCQRLRDSIAALRDRTTSLLARIGPPLIVPPQFTALQARHTERRHQRLRRIANSAWAASIVGAALLGWGLNRVPATPVTVALAPAAAQRVAVAPAPAALREPAPARPVTVAVSNATKSSRTPRLVRIGRTGNDAEPSWEFAHAVETDPTILHPSRPADPVTAGSISAEVPDFSAQPVAAAPELAGLWRTITPDSATGLRSGDIPLVPGLAVVQMRVQPGHGGGDVTAVDQALESGELIRTITGPAGPVGTLVQQNTELDPEANSSSARVTVTIRQGDRMVAVTGPSEALGSLLSRVSPRRRY
jgi:hypothetical protein